MARYIGPVCRLCRREGEKLFLKGAKCFSSKCPVEKRNFPPGQHGRTRRFKQTQYGLQLREKQKLKRIYGILERQFRRYFDEAEKAKGVTGEALIQVLERRLDNVVYRLGFAPSRAAARQLILHRHFLVNDRLVDIPSYLVKPGDVIKVRDKSKRLEVIHASMRKVREGKLLPWLTLDKAAMTGSFLEIPKRADVPVAVNESMVVELYSK